MYAWLIINQYLQSAKFDEIYDYLVAAAAKVDCELEKITNYQVLTNLSEIIEKRPDFVVCWDKDVRAAALLEKHGLKVYNCAGAIKICDDKSLTYIALADSHIKMPKTMVSPLTFGLDADMSGLVDVAISKMGLPFIIKENCGSFGAQVYKAENRENALEIIQKIGKSEFIIQEYIATSEGRDVRINIVGGKAVASMLRTNEGDFRANITNGGKMHNYTPTKQQEEMAKDVCRLLNLDFAGVDILFGENDEPILCEVNSNAHFKNIMDCTGINVAECIMEYIIGEHKSYGK